MHNAHHKDVRCLHDRTHSRNTGSLLVFSQAHTHSVALKLLGVYACSMHTRRAPPALLLRRTPAFAKHVPRLPPPQGKCSLLLIDNIGAFSWQDRASRPPIASNPQPPNPTSPSAPPGPLFPHSSPCSEGPPLTLQKVHAAASELLQLLAMRLRLAVVATKSAAVNWQEGGGTEVGRLVQREYLPPVWQVGGSCRPGGWANSGSAAIVPDSPHGSPGLFCWVGPRQPHMVQRVARVELTGPLWGLGGPALTCTETCLRARWLPPCCWAHALAKQQATSSPPSYALSFPDNTIPLPFRGS